MPSPAELDLTIYQGSTFEKSFQYKTGDPPTPVDITGVELRMQVRLKTSSTDVLIELTTDNNRITIDDAAEGKFSFLITDEDTALLDFKRGVYDLEIVWPNGKVNKLLKGAVELEKEVTREN